MAIKVTAINNMTDAKDDSFYVSSDAILATPGVVTPGNMQVTEQSTTTMGVRVSPGRVFVQNAGWVEGSSQPRYYQVKIDIPTNKSLNNNPSSNNWIVAICIKVDVGTSTPGAQGELAGTIEAIYGTADPSPVPPAIPNNHELLAYVTYNSSHTVITNARITDVRKVTRISPQVLPTTEGLINGRINVSVASNNLTVSILTSAGLTPTAQDPVGVVIDGTMRLITSALSVTANAGTNWFGSGSVNFATFERDYFVYIGFNAIDGVTLGFATFPVARIYSDFSPTSTNNLFCRISNITNATPNDPYVNVGRFAATLSAGNVWTVPTFTSKNLIHTPVFTSRDLNMNPAFMGFSAITISIGRYRVENSTCFLFLSCSGTSNSTNFTCTAPFKRPNIGNGVAYGPIRGQDNGSVGTVPRMWQINANSATVTFFSNYGGGLWIASGTKTVEGVFINYPII